MRNVRWNISAGAVLLFALMLFFDADGSVTAVLPAIMFHELGHIAALRFCRRRIRQVSVSVLGFELDYAPQIDGIAAALCFLAGPLTGLLYASLAAAASNEFLKLSGSLSFYLSVFNCLPILPLDGGRIVALLLPERVCGILSLICTILLLLGGIAAAFLYHRLSQLLIGAWLFFCNVQFLRKTGGN